MNDGITSTAMIDIAMQNFVEAIKDENIPDPGDGFRGFYGLPLHYRQLLFILNHYEWEIRNKGSQPGEKGQITNSVSTLLPECVLQSSDTINGMAEVPKVYSEGSMVGCGEKLPLPLSDVSTIEEQVFAPNTFPLPQEKIIEDESVTAFTQTPSSPLSDPRLSSVGAVASLSDPDPVSSLSVLKLDVGTTLPTVTAESDTNTLKPIETLKKSVYLKNARVGEPYDSAVEIDGLKSVRLDDGGDSGLIFDVVSGTLKGTPLKSGDFIIRLQGLLHGKRAEITANLAVIPDPKSLWVNIESDRNAPFWKPDEAFGRAEGDLFCVAASKRGRSHAKDGGFRDDDFGLLAIGSDSWHIAVVADGAGSAKFSRRGSKVAVDRILADLPQLLEDHVAPHLSKLVPAHIEGQPDADRQIKSQLYQSLVTSAFNAAKAIEEEAAAIGEKASVFSTTLIVGIAKKIPEGWFFAGFSIGDGGAAVFDALDGSLTTLSLPDSGEFAGQTRFLQKSEFIGGFDEIEKRIFFNIRKEFTAMALMTDGISDPKFPTDAAFADPMRWIDFWNSDLTKAVDFSRDNAELEKQFLGWMDFWSPGNHDDRTLAVLIP